MGMIQFRGGFLNHETILFLHSKINHSSSSVHTHVVVRVVRNSEFLISLGAISGNIAESLCNEETERKKNEEEKEE